MLNLDRRARRVYEPWRRGIAGSRRLLRRLPRPSPAHRPCVFARQEHDHNAEPFSMPESKPYLGRIAILWRGDQAERRGTEPETSRFKAVFAALAAVGVDAEPVVYEDDVLDVVRSQLATLDGVLVWVNPIHEGRNRAKLDSLLRAVAARGVWVSAHPDVVLKMGTKE